MLERGVNARGTEVMDSVDSASDSTHHWNTIRRTYCMKMHATLLALLLVALCRNHGASLGQGICYGVKGDLVTNCGFETGDFTGWSLTGNTGFTGVSSSIRYVNSGSFSAQLGPVGSDGSLSQNVGTNINRYRVSFYRENDGGTPNDFFTFFSGVLNGHAGGGSNTITFAYRQDPEYWGLDDVVVRSASPEPGSLMLMGSGILGLAEVVRRELRA